MSTQQAVDEYLVNIRKERTPEKVLYDDFMSLWQHAIDLHGANSDAAQSLGAAHVAIHEQAYGPF